MLAHIHRLALSLRSLLRALRAQQHRCMRMLAGSVGCVRYHTADTCIWQTDELVTLIGNTAPLRTR
jgi:hypothetical protein